MFEPAFSKSGFPETASSSKLNDNGTPSLSSRSQAEIRLVREAIRARAARTSFFKARFFSDPAWDILLDLYLAELRQRRLSVSAIGVSADVPLTTLLRWLDTLQREGLIERAADPLDGRRVFVTLSTKASAAMHSYFASLGDRPVML